MIRPSRDEDGAVAITVALILIVLILIAAFLVDLGWTRADARADQLVADAAVMAAANTEDDIVAQCRTAVDYFAANVGVSTYDATPCDALSATIPCSSSTSPETTDPISIGDFTMHVRHPVLTTDDAMKVQDYVPERDAQPCNRIKVSIMRTRDFVFGPAGGGASSGESTNDAVAVRFVEDEPETYGSLIVLETEACNALVANGSGEVKVLEGAPYVDDDGNTVIPEGVITVDSTADGGTGSNNCNTGTRYAIVAPASGCMEAADHIYSYGLLLDALNPHVYDAGSVEANACDPLGAGGINGGMSPEPEPGIVIGRKQVDWLFNCLAGYPPSGDPGNQRYPVPEHAENDRHGPCDDNAARPPYIDHLHGEPTHPGLQDGDLTTMGFYRVMGGTCPDVVYDGTTLFLDGVATATPAEPRLWMDCNFANGFSFDAVDLEYAVFESHAAKPNLFRIEGVADVGAVAYFRNGGIESTNSGSFVELVDTFVYVNSRSGDTAVNVTGGTLNWFAPVSDAIRATCEPYEQAHRDGDPFPSNLPPAGCFAPLALWSNSSETHVLAGNANITVEGSFFVPNGAQEIGGNGALDFTDSQFFARVLRTVGTGNLELVPNPQTNIPFPPPGAALIR